MCSGSTRENDSDDLLVAGADRLFSLKVVWEK